MVEAVLSEISQFFNTNGQLASIPPPVCEVFPEILQSINVNELLTEEIPPPLSVAVFPVITQLINVSVPEAE